MTAPRVAAVALLASAVLLESCAPTAAVATFAGNAEKANDAGAAVFADLHESCLRRHLAVASVNPAFFPPGVQANGHANPADIAACAAFAPEGEGLAKTSQLLSAYFRSMQQLASFNSMTISGAGGQTGMNIATASGLNTIQVDSLSKLAGLLSQAFTERYQQRDLGKMLTQADPSIESVTHGLEDIVAKDYQGLLREEEQTLPAEYQAVANVKDPATILLLNRAFTEDVNGLKRRRAVADAYVAALQQMREGHHLLAQKAKGVKQKRVALALQPYSDKLAALQPTLERHL